MRYDVPVYFQNIIPGEYDASTGNYLPDIMTEEKRYASVTNAGDETVQLIYGSLRQGSLTVRIQIHYNKPFSRIRIGEKLYRMDFQRKLRNSHVFVVSEVQG